MGNYISGQRGQSSRASSNKITDPKSPDASARQACQAGASPGLPALASGGARRQMLDSLPDGLPAAIAAYLPGPRLLDGQAQGLDEIFSDVISLGRLSKTCTFGKTIKKWPGGDDPLREARSLYALGQAVSKCLTELGEFHAEGVVMVRESGSLLGLLTPSVRRRCVQQAIGEDDLMARGEAIAGLAAGMAYLDHADRIHLVDAALELGLDDENLFWHAYALGGLLKAMEWLEPRQRKAIIEGTANLIEQYPPVALFGLEESIHYLPDAQREALVAFALHPVLDEERRAQALGGLGLAMAAEPSLNLNGRIVEAALTLVDDQHRAYAITHLAVGIGSMAPDLRSRFLAAAGGFTGEVSKTDVASKLGAAAEHLSDTERADLVRFATVPGAIAPSEAYPDLLPEDCMVKRLEGLAAGMAHLSPGQCDALSGAALGFGDANNRTYAIGVMFRGLAHLSIERREQLVAAAIAIGDEQPARMCFVIGQLSAGFEHLNNVQRKRLIDAVSAISGHPTALARLCALGALTSAVVAMEGA